MNATATKTRKPLTRSIWLDPIPADCSRTHVRIYMGHNAIDYWLQPVLSQLGGRAFQLEKFLTGGGDPEENTYHVRLDGQESYCDCKGHARHGHCKHADGIKALVAAKQL